MKKKLICGLCPNSCFLEVDFENKNVTGNNCSRGKVFAVTEITEPMRIVTTTIRTTGSEEKMLPVKTSKKVQKKLMFDCIHEIKKLKVTSPVKIGTILLYNILDTGADVIATANI